jgi:hypothetical protein
MGVIHLTGVTFNLMPLRNQLVWIRYRKKSDPDIPASYTQVAANAAVDRNGNLVPPLDILNILPDTYYTVWAVHKASGSQVLKDFGYFVLVKTQNFTKACTSPAAGTVVPFSKTYTSYVSQADAQAIADADAATYNSQGQANANANGVCHINHIVLNANEQATPFADLNSEIKLNGVHLTTMNGTGTYNSDVAPDQTVHIEVFAELPSDGLNPTMSLEVYENDVLIQPMITEPSVPGGDSIQWSKVMVRDATYRFETSSAADPNIPVVPCDSPATYSGGESFPTETTITLGVALGHVVLNYNAYSIPDKYQVIFDGVVVIDTGYRGDASEQSGLDAALAAKGLPPETIAGTGIGTDSFEKTTATTTALVRVWAPMSGTSWDFTMNCPV